VVEVTGYFASQVGCDSEQGAESGDNSDSGWKQPLESVAALGRASDGREESLMKASALTMEMNLRMKLKLKNSVKFKLGLRPVIPIGKARARASIQSRDPAWGKNTHCATAVQFLACTSGIAAERHPRLLV
jgi:hypothetical protein